MEAPATRGRAHDDPAVRTVDGLFDLVRAGEYGPDPAHERISLAFTTSQAVRHEGRAAGYRNEVLSLRLDAAVGSCAVEPGALPGGALDDCVGTTVSDLLGHPLLPVRIAALDAYLAHVRPHTPIHGARPHPLPGGSSLSRSRARARAVVDLLPAPAAGPSGVEHRPVLVVGVVNSLLEQLRSRGLEYLPCDLKGGATEWGEPVLTDTAAQLERCGAVLASGMTLGNGTFQGLLDHAAATGKPLVMFAQTGSAVLPRFLGAGVSAVSAEPYPFFWLDGGPGTIHRYGDHA
ncbi:Rossmann-like domain-containing protein [Streptomyces sp. NPDC059835]|uniref:Rossmann-like domain-containing protein n=1 Tax=Streptomyces sp. NPDC059835 TaxID=3346967 RepID=UPI003665171A